MKNLSVSWSANARFAQTIWGQLPTSALGALKQLTRRFALSVEEGDLLLLDNKWYITHGGLLRIAQRNHCSGMKTAVDKGLSDPASSRWVFRATV
jgi:hypothetical protein